MFVTPEIAFSEKLRPILTSKKRFIVILGGRGSGKSVSIGDYCLARMLQGTNVACFREYQNSIDKSVYGLLKAEASRLNLPGFEAQLNTYKNTIANSEAVFLGLARNIDSVKSLHGFPIAWVEEAQTLSEESLQILTRTFRKAPGTHTAPQLIFTLNPGSSEDPVSQRFVEPYITQLRSNGFYEDDLHLIIKCNYYDNPWFKDSGLEKERAWDELHLDKALYEHIWLGEYNDSVEHSIIKSEWFDACVDAHKKLGIDSTGQIVATHDPADSSDARAYAIRHGIIIKDVAEDTTLDVNQAARWACESAHRQRADVFIWDADGLGLALREQIRGYFDNTHVTCHEFRGGGSVQDPDQLHMKHDSQARQITNKEAFYNLRSQMYARLRERVYKTYQAVAENKYKDPHELISFDSTIKLLPQLRAELCRIPQVFTANGIFQVMRKDMMKSKLKIKSPNLADCVMMSEYLIKPKEVKNTKSSIRRVPRLNVA